MKSLEELLDERMKERMVEALNKLDQAEFRDLIVRLMEHIGLEVTAVAIAGGVVHLEAEGKEGSYLITASRDPRDGSRESLLKLKEKARYMDRQPVIVVTYEMDEEVRDLADGEEIAYADLPKLLSLLRKYDMEHELLEEMDRHILAEEGSRYLPSVGRFESLLRDAEIDHREGRHSEALAKLDRALQLKPERDDVLRRKARILYEMGDHQRAIDTCQRALRIREDSPETWFLLGLLLHELGDYDGELEAYDSALKYRPRMVSALINKGATLYELGRYTEAIKIYDRLLEMMPRETKAMNNRALVLKALGKHSEALAQLNKLLSVEPGNRDALINRATLLQEMGRTADALEAWRELVSLDRKNVEAWLHLGKAQKEAGLFEEAARSFSVAASLAPGTEEAIREREECLRAAGISNGGEPGEAISALCRRYLQASRLLEAVGNPVAALGEVNKCLELDPDDRTALLRRAQLQLTLGHLEEALASLKELARFHSDDLIFLDLEALIYRMGWHREGKEMLERVALPEARRREVLMAVEDREERAVELCRDLPDDDISKIIAAVAMLQQGRWGDAEKLLRKMIQKYPYVPELLNQLGVCLRFTGNLDGAKEYFQRALGIAPKYADAWNNLGCVFFLSGVHEEAERCFRQAVLVEKRPEYLVNLGMSQLAMEKVEAAADSFMQALRMERIPEAVNGLGVVAERRKELVKALEFYEAALEIAPSFRDAQMNRERVRKMLKE